MISIFIGSFLRGLLLILILDFILFAGMMGNYFNFLEIKEYFNPIFVDNQIYTLILLLAFPIGYMFSYEPFNKIFTRVYLGMLLLFSLTFTQSIGFMVGNFIFSKKSTIEINQRKMDGEILYVGRKYIYFREAFSEKVLKFEKELIIYY